VLFCCGLRPLSIADSDTTFSQRHAITHQAYSAILVLATAAIIDPVAVADVEAALAAVPPDCVLDEPGKDRRRCKFGLDYVERSELRDNLLVSLLVLLITD